MPALRALLLGCLVAGLLAAAARPQLKEFLATTQTEAGSWPVVDFGGQPGTELRVHAWLLLAMLGDGSTMRAGPSRLQIRHGVGWLVKQQDDRGRFALRADPEWLGDQAVATYALIEAARLSRYRLRVPTAARATAALARELAVRRPVPGADVRVWSRLCVLGLQRFAVEAAAIDWLDADQAAALATQLRAAAEPLEQILAALPPCELRTARELAAAELLQEVGGLGPEDRAAAPASWPVDPAADPLATFFAAATALRRGKEAWAKVAPGLEAAVIETQITDLARRDVYGTWDPAGSFGAEHGRLGQSAVSMLGLEVYYRYCKLGLFD